MNTETTTADIDEDMLQNINEVFGLKLDDKYLPIQK